MEKFMKRALELAKLGQGYVNPNPLVGAVLVRDGQVISEGYHQKYGGPHAEVHAIGERKNLEACSLYVTLEPCCHHGKTPPCTELIIKAGIKHVVIASLDPNPLVAGKGVQILRDHGIKVEVGLLEDQSKKMNEIFNHYIINKSPFVIMKYASTLDGKIATLSGDSKWITSDIARRHVHETRHKVMGILVGSETIIKDDPLLTARIDKGVNPRVIVLDSRGSIPLSSKIFDNNPIIATTDLMPEDKKRSFSKVGQVIVTKNLHGRVDLEGLLYELGKLGMDSVLVEGGGQVHGSFLKKGLVNKVQVYLAPKLLGQGRSAINGLSFDLMSQAINLKDISYQNLGHDLLIEGYLERSQPCLQASLKK